MVIDSKQTVERTDMQYILSRARGSFEALANNSLLITGAGGFLGYYFIKSILNWNSKYPKKEVHLTILSTFRKGVPPWLRQLQKSKKLTVLKKDVTYFTIPESFFFDYIIHGASIASPIVYREFPIETINANVQGLYNVLNYILKKNKGRLLRGLLYFSSSEIYGDPPEEYIPTPENYRGNVSCTGPRACYDESKRFCETLCVNYSQVYNLPIKVARPFNNYGPGMKITDGRVIADFSKNILGGVDLWMYSTGSPSRTFCYVADAIIGYFKVLTKGKKGEAYNIGIDEQETSVEMLAREMIAIGKENFGYKGKIIKMKSRDKEYLTDNPQRRRPDISKAKKELDYNPSITLQDGLRRTLYWYKG